jgi:hypothetical protein
MSLQPSQARWISSDANACRSRIVRTAVVMTVGTLALVGMSYAAVSALASPHGWASQAAGEVAAAEQSHTAALTSFYASAD